MNSPSPEPRAKAQQQDSTQDTLYAARKKLFKGFDTVAPGKASRRRADTMHFDDLRTWMDDFCVATIAQIKAWRDDV